MQRAVADGLEVARSDPTALCVSNRRVRSVQFHSIQFDSIRFDSIRVGDLTYSCIRVAATLPQWWRNRMPARGRIARALPVGPGWEVRVLCAVYAIEPDEP